jgi:hypothetical protein
MNSLQKILYLTFLCQLYHQYLTPLHRTGRRILEITYSYSWGTQWCRSRKVAGSIPIGVIGMFH